MQSNKEIKAFGFEFEVKESEGAMTIEGYGSTFRNTDRGGDIVQRGAFVKSLVKRMPKMLWQHDTRKVCGVWTEANEDSKGLYVKGSFVNTTLGRDSYELAKAGAIDTMSIGYSTNDCEYDQKVRLIKEAELYEVSLVTFPMNEQAKIIAVKSLPQTVREFEGFLRDAGFNREDATAIASCGFKKADSLRDADSAALLESLNSILTKIKG
jgi:hypothetical protein